MARARGTSWLLTHHHGPLFDRQGRPARAAVDRWATRRMGHVVAVSSEVRAYLVGRCGIPDKFIEHAERAELLADLGLNADGLAAVVRRHREAIAAE